MSIKQLTQPVAWRRFTDKAELNAYLGLPGEPVIDASVSPYVLRVCDGVTPGGNRVGIDESIAGVAIPEIVAPVSGSIDVALSPVITASRFNGLKNDGTADNHAASYWEVSAKEDFSTFVYQSGRNTVDLKSIDLAAKAVTLTKGAKYYARVAYEGASGNLSKWSAVSSFTVKRWIVPEYQLAKLLGSDNKANSDYGCAVALSGDCTTAVIGAYSYDLSVVEAGAAYVFVKSGSGWVQQAKLTASDADATDHLAVNVAISHDGNTIALSADYDDEKGSNAGAAYIFVRNPSTGAWTQQTKLTASDGQASSNFGRGVSLSKDGNTLVVGAFADDQIATNAGAVYIFTRSGTTWTQKAKLTASDAKASAGLGIMVCMAADGNTMAVGASTDSTTATGSYEGAAYIFVRNPSTGVWTQQAKIYSSDLTTVARMGLGLSLSADGNTFCVSAPYDNTQGAEAGVVFVYTRSGTTWSKQARLLPSDVKAGTHLGYSVSLSADGNILLVGADLGGTESSGAVYVYVRDNGVWIQHKKLSPPDNEPGDQFGRSVSLSPDGSMALISAYRDNQQNGIAGSAYILG